MEEAQEEVLINSKNNNRIDQQSHIVKGKRSKRQRPQSPIPFIVNTNNNVSPAGSSAEEFLDSTEEDEDMANCLIMLAQCQSRESSKRAHFDHQEQIGEIQIQNHNSKFKSRRLLESPSSDTGMMGTGQGGGCYVYECKTCNRTFPSFQALGGHRASHKKPKAAVVNNDERSFKSQQQQFHVSNSDEEDDNFRNVSSLCLQLSNNNNNTNNRGGNNNLYSSSSNNMKSNKIHECSICGAEFTSGQALGGHMRRHRAAPVATTTNTTLSLTPMAVEVEELKISSNNKLSLDLDLNLPAPEDDLRESKLPFSSKKQQPQQQQQQQKSALVYSAVPTLVDCHY